MSTTTRTSRGKPVTLAKTASGDLGPSKKTASKTEAKPVSAKSAKDPGDKMTTAHAAAPASKPAASQIAAPASEPTFPSDAAFQAKWNDLLKAQSEAALAWWQDAKDARTVADAIAVNTRHSRLQFEIATSQAREMATFFQKTLEGNAERFRALITPPSH